MIIVTHNPIFEGLGTLVVKFKDGVVSQMYRNENPKPVDELPWGHKLVRFNCAEKIKPSYRILKKAESIAD